MLGTALCCVLGACPVFVAGTGREISSLSIDKPGILTPIFVAYPVFSAVLCNNYFRFRSVLGFIPSLYWGAKVYWEGWTKITLSNKINRDRIHRYKSYTGYSAEAIK